MFRFIVRRLLQLIPTLFGLSILLFIWLRRLPGGPETAILGERGTPEMRAAIRRNLGLDEPILVQYGRFMRRMHPARPGHLDLHQAGGHHRVPRSASRHRRADRRRR